MITILERGTSDLISSAQQKALKDIDLEDIARTPIIGEYSKLIIIVDKIALKFKVLKSNKYFQNEIHSIMYLGKIIEREFGL